MFIFKFFFVRFERFPWYEWENIDWILQLEKNKWKYNFAGKSLKIWEQRKMWKTYISL
jgi:hypothetical protein